MARIAIASGFSYILPWAARLQDEGHKVMIWNKTPGLKRVAQGIIPLAGTMAEAEHFIKQGHIAREPVLFFFDATGMGEDADRIRKWGIPVAGGGSFMDKLEKDRAFGFDMAEQAGCNLPPYEQYTSLSESEKSSQEGEFYFKSDRYLEGDATKGLKDKEHQIEYFSELRDRYGDNIKHILQTKIDGVPLSTARWWNGMNWTGPYEATYEHKAFMDGDVGPSTGCSFNAVFFHKTPPKIAESLGWENLTTAFRKNQAPAGLYDINAVVAKDGQVYFLEWTPRLGFDSEMTSFRLIPDLGAHLFAVAEGREVPEPDYDLAYSIRLSVPPYPWEYGKLDQKGCCDGKPVRRVDGLWDGSFIGGQLRVDDEMGLCVAGAEGYVGLSLAVGDDLKEIHEEALDYAKELGKAGITGLQYRTDGAERIKEDAEAVKASGHEVPSGIL